MFAVPWNWLLFIDTGSLKELFSPLKRKYLTRSGNDLKHDSYKMHKIVLYWVFHGDLHNIFHHWIFYKLDFSLIMYSFNFEQKQNYIFMKNTNFTISIYVVFKCYFFFMTIYTNNIILWKNFKNIDIKIFGYRLRHFYLFWFFDFIINIIIWVTSKILNSE